MSHRDHDVFAEFSAYSTGMNTTERESRERLAAEATLAARQQMEAAVGALAQAKSQGATALEIERLEKQLAEANSASQKAATAAEEAYWKSDIRKPTSSPESLSQQQKQQQEEQGEHERQEQATRTQSSPGADGLPNGPQPPQSSQPPPQPPQQPKPKQQKKKQQKQQQQQQQKPAVDRDATNPSLMRATRDKPSNKAAEAAAEATARGQRSESPFGHAVVDMAIRWQNPITGRDDGVSEDALRCVTRLSDS